MNLRPGDIVTSSFLVEYFRKAFVHLNDIKNISSITSGQIVDKTNGVGEMIVNSFSEQFFDNQKNYLDNYYNELNDIEG